VRACVCVCVCACVLLFACASVCYLQGLALTAPASFTSCMVFERTRTSCETSSCTNLFKRGSEHYTAASRKSNSSMFSRCSSISLFVDWLNERNKTEFRDYWLTTWSTKLFGLWCTGWMFVTTNNGMWASLPWHMHSLCSSSHRRTGLERMFRSLKEALRHQQLGFICQNNLAMKWLVKPHYASPTCVALRSG
jgi:hypothetical protein